MDGRVDTVSATANTALTGYTMNLSAINTLETSVTNNKDEIDAIVVANQDQWQDIYDIQDSISVLDTVKITQDNIPTAKNRQSDLYRADGGKLVRADAGDGNFKYSYTPSLPLAEIVDSVVGSIGGAPTDTVSAVAAINEFFNIILNNYQPNVTFSVDDYDT